MTQQKEPGPAKAAKAAARKPRSAAKTAPAAKPAPAAEPAPLVVEVIGPKRGRWRAGRRFGPEPVVIPLADLSEGDKAALIADPKLSVTTREADPE